MSEVAASTLDPAVARRRRLRLWLFLPTLIAVLLAGLAMAVRRPTTVMLDLQVDHFGFVVAKQERDVLLLDETPFSALDIHLLQDASLRRGDLLRLPPGAFDCAALPRQATDKFLPDPLELQASDRVASALLVEVQAGAPSATLSGVYVAGGTRVDLGAPPATAANAPPVKAGAVAVKQGGLRVGIVGRESRVLALLPGPFRLDGYALMSGEAGGVAQPGQFSLCGRPAATAELEARGGSGQALHLDLSLPAGDSSLALVPAGVRVAELDFTRLDAEGRRLSTLVGAGRITYPDDLAQKEMAVEAKDYVRIAGMQDFRIKTLEWRPEHGELRLRAQGQAGELRVGPEGAGRDARLTWFASLSGSPALVALFGILVWVFPTTVAGWKLWKETGT